MWRSAASVAALTLVAAACGAATTPTPTAAPATPTPPTATPTPAPATPAPSSAARVIPASVTFDGTSCTYAGPSVVPLGSAFEWTFETTAATAEERSSWELIVWEVRPDATWDDIVAWAAANALAQQPPYRWPPWSVDGVGRTVELLVSGEPMRTPVEHYPVLVSCGVGVGDVTNGETVYPAKLIGVMKG